MQGILSITLIHGTDKSYLGREVANNLLFLLFGNHLGLNKGVRNGEGTALVRLS